MIGFIGLFNNENVKIEKNLEKIRQKKCDSHNKYQASYCCINPSCYVDELFSTKRLVQIKENCKIDPAYQEKIHQVLQDLDHIFGKSKENINKIKVFKSFQKFSEIF